MKRTFMLEGLDCANCAAKMERKVSAIKGVEDASVNFMTQKLTLFCEDSLTGIHELVEKAVHKVDDQVIVKELS